MTTLATFTVKLTINDQAQLIAAGRRAAMADGYSEEVKDGSKNDLVDLLLQPEYLNENLAPYPFKKDRKKKKKKGISI